MAAVDVDESDALPRAGEHVLACRHIITGTPDSVHWYRHSEAAQINAPDGRTFDIRFMMACTRCHARILKGKPALALMAGDRVWTEEDVAEMAGKEPRAGS
jgi:hypothetical protein